MGEHIPRRKVPMPKRFKALWHENDVIAYHLVNIVDNQWFKKSDFWFYGKYILLKIVNIQKVPMSKIMPELICDEWMYCSVYDWIGDEIPDLEIINNLNFHPLEFNAFRQEYDYVAIIYSSVVHSDYKQKHDAVVIGNDISGKMPPRLESYSYNADAIEFLLSHISDFTPEGIGYYNINGMS